MKKLTAEEIIILVDLLEDKISEEKSEIEERKFQMTGMKDEEEIQDEKDEIRFLEERNQEWKIILGKIKKLKKYGKSKSNR